MRTRVAKLAFNRGLVSRLGIARADIKRLALAAETQVNWVPRVLGSMMLRPGWGHLGESLDNQRAFHLPFVFSITDKALLEITDGAMRVWVNESLITRPSVTSAVTNGTFTTDLTGWTDADESGATSAWQTGGFLGLTGDGTAFAIRRQQVTVPLGFENIEHALHIVIERGPVILRVGSTSGGDDFITETELTTGDHSLAFTPTGTSFWIDFKNRLERIVLVDECTIEAAGVMAIATPWAEADLRLIRFDQSGDVIFVACGKVADNIGYQPFRIERRATRSWSAVLYEPPDGPFDAPNVTATTITASGLSGNVTLTASNPLFRAGHVGALFQITSVGQTVASNISAQNTFTNSIRVTGVGSVRSFTISLTGTWSATVTLQRSFDEGVSWIDLSTFTANTASTFDDGLDNQIVLYRIGVKTGNYTSGTVEAALAITTGSITGVARITSFTSNLLVAAEVITDLGSLIATEDWAEGLWSDFRGWPTSVAFYEGRLSWAGRDGIDLSVSDAFDSFDPDFEGDAAPISRTIGSGPVDTINWLLALQRLLLGAQGAEFSVRSSSLDEPLTTGNFNLKAASTQGSAAVAAVKVDQNGIFVQRGGIRVYELAFGQNGVDYEASQLSALIPEIGSPGIVKIVVQRQPDTRLHFVRSDGTVAMLVFDKLEQVICWLELETAGEVEDAVVLPGDAGDEEDFVYYSAKRTVNGATKRFLEKWAFEEQCRGDAALCKLADSFTVYTGVLTQTITGLSHLEQQNVVVWADGADIGTEANHSLSTPGASGSNASAPHSTLFSIVGDLDLRARLATNWAPGSATAVPLVDKSDGISGYRFIIASTDRLRLDVFVAGALRIPACTVPVGVSSTSMIEVRVTRSAATGNTNFFTSVDEGETWTLLGAADVSSTAGNISVNTLSLKIGAAGQPGLDTLAGRVERAQVYDGIDGTLVADFNPNLCEVGATSFTAATGEVWTISGTARITEQRYRVVSGAIALEAPAENVVVGLPYQASWKSAKLVELMEQLGGSLSDTQMIKGLALILADVHAKGLKYGPSLTESEMNDMPETEDGAVVDPDAVREDYSGDPVPFPGTWSANARLCLLAKAPRPCTVLGALAEVEHHG